MWSNIYIYAWINVNEMVEVDGNAGRKNKTTKQNKTKQQNKKINKQDKTLIHQCSERFILDIVLFSVHTFIYIILFLIYISYF